MNYRKTLRVALIACGLTLGGAASAATPSASMLANTCAGCHGTNGSSHGPATPTIAGISSEYFIETMKAYRDGTRPATIMGRIAKGYTDEEIQAMAGYFAKQKFERMAQKHDAKAAERGKQLHKRYCEKCHSEGGRATEDDAGILAGQWQPYLHFTLTDFMSGARETPKKMAKRLEALKAKEGDAGVEQLLNYYASQK